MNRFGRNGWGFAIDYDKEIAADLALLADVETCLERGWVKPDGYAYCFSLTDLALSSAEGAALVGLTDVDRACLGDAHELPEAEFARLGIPPLEYTDTGETPGQWYRRGDAIAKRLAESTAWSSDLLTREQLAKWRKKSKADLARHRRNQTKFGR